MAAAARDFARVLRSSIHQAQPIPAASQAGPPACVMEVALGLSLVLSLFDLMGNDLWISFPHAHQFLTVAYKIAVQLLGASCLGDLTYLQMETFDEDCADSISKEKGQVSQEFRNWSSSLVTWMLQSLVPTGLAADRILEGSVFLLAKASEAIQHECLQELLNALCSVRPRVVEQQVTQSVQVPARPVQIPTGATEEDSPWDMGDS
eukprot:s2061_g7.t1